MKKTRRKRLEVITYSGAKQNERPLAFFVDGKRYSVKKCVPLGKEIDIWGARKERYFVETEEGARAVLLFFVDDERWSLISFEN